jgi:hypothetical protein
MLFVPCTCWSRLEVVKVLNLFFTEPESPSTNAAESDEDHTHLPTPEDALRPLPAIDFLLGDFSRRFERQSWRIRHEEERRRLKQNFEVSCSTPVLRARFLRACVRSDPCVQCNLPL